MVKALKLHVRKELGPIAVHTEIDLRPYCLRRGRGRSCGAC